MRLHKWVILFFIGFSVLWSSWLLSYAFLPGPRPTGGLTSTGPQTVLIPSHTAFAGIKKILVSEGLIRDDCRFTLLAVLLGVTHRLKAGEYCFYKGQTPYKILTTLERGKIVLRPVMIPEGADVFAVADILAAAGWVDKERFLALTHDSFFIKELGLPVAGLEGYLFPDTYFLARGYQTEQDIVGMMVDRGKKIFDECLAKAQRHKYSAARTPLSRHEVLTLASIVEKETGLDHERSLIAGVFLNRLRRGMYLQADPTVIYGRPVGRSGDLTNRDLRTPSPYNTYLNKGLPPGPICNPGRAAIEAVLLPAAESYLYFVSKNDGSHYFSKTLAEHNRAVTRFQKKRGAGRRLSGGNP